MSGNKGRGKQEHDSDKEPSPPDSVPGLIHSLLSLFGRYKVYVFVCTLVIGISAVFIWWTRETSRDLGVVNEQQIKITKDVLEIHSKVLEQVKSSYETLQTYATNLIEANSKLAETTRSRNEENTINQKKIDQLNADAAKTKADLADRDRAFDQAAKEALSLRTQLVVVSNELVTFKGYATNLAGAITGYNQSNQLSQESRLLSSQILGLKKKNPSGIVSEFASGNYSNSIVTAISLTLSSYTMAELRDLININGIGLGIWFDQGNTLFGAAGFDGRTMTNVIIVNGRFDGVWVELYSSWRVLRAVDKNNLYQTSLFSSYFPLDKGQSPILYQGYDNFSKSNAVPIGTLDGYRLAWPKEPDKLEKYQWCSVTEIDELLQSTDARAIEWLAYLRGSTPYSRGFNGLPIWLVLRSASFGSQAISDLQHPNLQKEPEQTLRNLLFAAARREFDKAMTFVIPPVTRDDIGQIGAAVLYPDFRISSVDNGQTTFSAAQAAAPKAARYLYIDAEFGRDSYYNTVERVRITMTQSEANGLWRVSDIKFPRVSAL